MSLCQAKKSNGEPCQGRTRGKWCPYHQKKFGANVTHGLKSTPDLLGIPDTEQLTFDQFHQLNKPFELTSELAYLRTLLVEQRRSMESSRDTSREMFINDLRDRTRALLLEANMKEAVVDKFVNAVHPVWVSIIEGHYGPVEPLQPEHFHMLADMIEKISRVAEKAKKIQDGITLNVEFKNVGPIIVRFVQQIMFAEICDPLPPNAAQLRQNIVARVRNLNLTGQSVRALPVQVVEDED